MTGPGPGKVRINGAVNMVTDEGSFIKLNYCDIYIHVKGYSRARVTHVDIESPLLGMLRMPNGRYVYARVLGLPRGFKVVFNEALLYSSKRVKELIVRWDGPKILGIGRSSIVYVGLKEGGVFLGFKKEVIRILEDYVRNLGISPK